MLTFQRAKELNDTMITEEHLKIHALNVCYSMGAMAEHFGEDKEHWMAVGIFMTMITRNIRTSTSPTQKSLFLRRAFRRRTSVPF